MPPFELTVLGSSSALPATGRNPSAHVLNIHGRFYLIDCGEGTQMQMRRFGQKIQKIEAIFISHLHGDHYFGLPGLLGTLHLLGRTQALEIFAPEGLKEIIDIQHKYAETFLRYPLHVHELNTENASLCYETEKMTVHTIPLNHRIPCCGFLFREKPVPGSLNIEAVEKYRISKEYYIAIKQGNDHRKPDGTIIPNAALVHPAKPIRSFAYCSDTKADRRIVQHIKGVDLLFHEATFSEEHKDKAEATFHSTASDAAEIAREAAVKRLLIGHFSARYENAERLVQEAKAIFPETGAVEEGSVYPIIC